MKKYILTLSVLLCTLIMISSVQAQEEAPTTPDVIVESTQVVDVPAVEEITPATSESPLNEEAT